MSDFLGRSSLHGYPWNLHFSAPNPYRTASLSNFDRTDAPLRDGYGNFVARLVTRIADELRMRRDIRRLSGMDDHLLRDIGVTRDTIDTAVRRGS